MEILNNLLFGLSVAGTFQNVLYCFIGAMIGTAIGILPGLGPTATIAMLLPLTFGLEPSSAMIMLAGIYYGAQYGGSTTAILVNLPGESSSIVTALDGYQMARQGKAGKALAIAAIGSFVAGTLATLLIALLAPLLTEIALSFGPAEYFSLMVLGLCAAVVLATGSLVHSVGMVFVGLLLGLVGTDTNSGAFRFTFGFPELIEGLSFIALSMGLFGVSEILRNLESDNEDRSDIATVTSLMPDRTDLREASWPILRGSGIGAVLGILPGGGAMIASFAAYAVEKRISRHPEEFGRGALAGLAAPESANNAAAQMSFVPMLTLGIPSNPVMALMIGALIIQGIQPGPSMMANQPGLFWGLIVSMWIGNLLLLVLNLPLVRLWARMITIPYHFLFPAILVFCAIGAYGMNSSLFDIRLLVVFGAVGYLLQKLNCELAPLLLGFILGPMMEEYLRRTFLVAHGDATVFLTRPISLVLLIIAAALLLSVLLPVLRRTREEAFESQD